MAEQLFVALYTDAGVIHGSANGKERRSLICLFASASGRCRITFDSNIPLVHNQIMLEIR